MVGVFHEKQSKPATRTADAAKARFLAEQRVAFAPARLAVECAVCGSDYGGNSWTTMAKAEQVAEMLADGPEDRLLEVGAGSGWPGLYVAGHTGCDLVMSDIPHLGLGTAMARAEADGLAGRNWAAVAAEEENGEAIQEVHGDADFAARLARRKLLVVVLEEGLARREVFAATATSRALT